MLVCHTGLLLHILLTGGVQGEDHTTGGSVGGDSHESLVGGDHGDDQSLVFGGDMTETLEDFDSEPSDLDPLDLDPLDLPDLLDGGDSTVVDGGDQCSTGVETSSGSCGADHQCFSEAGGGSMGGGSHSGSGGASHSGSGGAFHSGSGGAFHSGSGGAFHSGS
jgi:hypothetical protein